MPIIPRGFDDVLLDRIKTKLTAFRDREAAIDSNASFDIDIERAQPWTATAPLVNLALGPDANDSGKSSGLIRSGTLTIRAEAYAHKKSSRLRYLKAQILAGIFDATTMPYFGFLPGEIDIKHPTWTPIDFEDYELAKSLFAGVWSFEVGYTWIAPAVSGTALSEFRVNTGLWSGIYPL